MKYEVLDDELEEDCTGMGAILSGLTRIDCSGEKTVALSPNPPLMNPRTLPR